MAEARGLAIPLRRIEECFPDDCEDYGPMEGDFVHVKLFRDYQRTRGSDHYEPEVEVALGRLGLSELFGPSE